MSDLSGYSSPLLSIWNQQAEQIKNENITIFNSASILKQVPDPNRKVQIDNYVECTDDRVLSGNLFRVDYDTGVLSFSSDIVDGTSVLVTSYYGRGVLLLPGKRIYVDSTNPDAPTNIQDLIDNYNNLNGVDLYTKFDPNAGHDHSGTAGSGPQLSANNIIVEDSNNVFNSYDVENVLYENYNNISSNTKQVTDGRGGFSTLKDKFDSYAVNIIDFGASGSDQYTFGSISSESYQLTVNSAIDFKVGQGIAIEGAGSNSTYEVASLQITNSAIQSGNIIVTLDNSPTNISVLSGNSAIQIADKIRNTSFSGWTTGGSSGTDTVTFTANTYGDKIDASYSAGNTGASGNIITVTQGNSDLLISSIDNISGTTITLADMAGSTVSGEEVQHDDSVAFKNAISFSKQNEYYNVYFPSGTYLIQIADPIVIDTSSFMIKGNEYNHSIIKFTQSGSGLSFDTGDGSNLYRIRLEDIRLHGGNSTNNLILIPNHTEELVFKNTVLTASEGALINAPSLALCWFNNCDFTYADSFIEGGDISSVWINNINFYSINNVFNLSSQCYFIYLTNSWIEACDRIFYGQTGFSSIASFQMENCIYLKDNGGTSPPFEFESPTQSYFLRIANSKFTINSNCGTIIRINSDNTSVDLNVFIEHCFFEASNNSYLTSIIKTTSGSKQQYTRLRYMENSSALFSSSDDLIDGNGLINALESTITLGTGQRGFKFGDLDTYAGRIYFDNSIKRLNVTDSNDVGHLISIQNEGSTANRPFNNLQIGDFYFDITLGKPIWWNGSVWVDSTGSSV